MTVIVRFAPSPTGYLHVGNVRTALLNWLFAAREKGQFILRLDDTDTARSREEYALAIGEDLQWLGLEWDRIEKQSDRLGNYEAAADRLRETGRLYPCYETPEELETKRKLQLARRMPPVYDRAALEISADEKAALEEAGRTPHWRFRLEHEIVEWNDGVRGDSHIDTASLSDPVLIRADGSMLYTLPSVVDDIDFGVSHIIRGEDHVANTAVQIQLCRALGAIPPEYAHHALLAGSEGEGLSKRLGSLSIRDLRESGIEPLPLLSLLAKTGSSDAIELRREKGELVTEFDLAHLSRATARFDLAELRHLNARYLHETPFEELSDRLAPLGVREEALWLAVRANIETLSEVEDWVKIIEGPLSPPAGDADFLTAAASLLPEAPLDETSWKHWTDAIKAETGRKGRDLFLPLRLALTGCDHGPEMKNLLPLITRDRALARLRGETA